MPEEPSVPLVPSVPSVPEEPSVPEVPSVPFVPEVPSVPLVPDVAAASLVFIFPKESITNTVSSEASSDRFDNIRLDPIKSLEADIYVPASINVLADKYESEINADNLLGGAGIFLFFIVI